MMRAATAADCAALAVLDSQCNPSPWSAAQFQTALGNMHDFIWLLEIPSNGIAGFVVWQTLFDESELHLIATAPALRRQGIAAQLLAVWLQAASEQGVRRCFLEVRTSNAAAQALYHKHGFAECGRRLDYYPLPDGSREDALWMEKLC